jgi:hypothetical protein
LVNVALTRKRYFSGMSDRSPAAAAMAHDAFPEVAPLIASLAADGIDSRTVLARALTDLFVCRSLHSQAELEQFEALVAPLIGAIDLHSATVVARKLAAHAETPRAVLDALLARDDEASFQLLRDGVTFDTAELDRLAGEGSRFAAVAIASRPSLAETTAAILADRDECVVDLALARRPVRELPEPVLALLVGRARSNADLARLLLASPGLPFLDACALFPQAEPHVRAAMAAEATRRAFLLRARPSPFLRGRVDEELARLGADREALAAALADWLGLTRDDAAGMVADATGEALILALRACGARPEAIVALLLRRGVHLSRSVERVFALDHLARETSAAGAAMVVQAFAQARPRPARHVVAPGLPRDPDRLTRGQPSHPAQERSASLPRRDMGR